MNLKAILMNFYENTNMINVQEYNIYGNFFKKILLFVDRIKFILIQSKKKIENENILDYLKNCLDFYNCFFITKQLPNLAFIEIFVSLILDSFNYLDYKYINIEIVNAIYNLTKTIVEYEKYAITQECLKNDKNMFEENFNHINELARNFNNYNNKINLLTEKILDVIIEGKYLNNIMDINYITKINENPIYEKDNIVISNMENEYSNSEDFSNNQIEENLVLSILKIFENIFSFKNKQKLNELVNRINDIYYYLYEIYLYTKNSLVKNKISSKIYENILQSILNIIIFITANPETLNVNFLHSNISNEIFLLETFKTFGKNLRNKTLIILNNIIYKAKEITFEVAEIISKDILKIIKEILLNENDNNSNNIINMCLNFLYVIFLSGEVLNENNFLLLFEIECGVEILEKLYYNPLLGIRAKIDIIVRKLLLNEKNINYLRENNLYINKNNFNFIKDMNKLNNTCYNYSFNDTNDKTMEILNCDYDDNIFNDFGYKIDI